ncbi:MAG: hypothetical protein HY775_11635 [Acidobacteria bacterium]|nr:hypothetical protein [Acidobacteriota bacterium]
MGEMRGESAERPGRRPGVRALAGAALLALVLAPVGAGAQGHEQVPPPPEDLLASVGEMSLASCVAAGLVVDAGALLPARIELSRSDADAGAWAWVWGREGGAGGQGHSHSDAAQAKAQVPPTLGEGLVTSGCDADAQVQANPWGMYGYTSAKGYAETEQLALDLGTLTLTADVLREDGSSTNGYTGGNTANVVDVWLNGAPVVSHSEAPNTAVSLGPLGTLFVNEQRVYSGGFCGPIFWGDALRLVLNDPSGAPAAQVIVSWVSTATCLVGKSG